MSKDNRVRLDPWRPRAFNDAKEMERQVQLYFDSWKEQKRPVLFVGLAIWLGVHRDTLREYAKGVYDSEENNFSDVLHRANDYIENEKWEKGLTGEYNSLITRLDLSVNHGKHEKTESIIQNAPEQKFEIDLSSISLEKATQTYKELLKRI